MDKIRSEQEGVLMKLKEEWRVEGERLNSAIIAIKEEAASSASVAAAKASAELDAVVKLVKEQQATVLQESSVVTRLRSHGSMRLIPRRLKISRHRLRISTPLLSSPTRKRSSSSNPIINNLLPSSTRPLSPSRSIIRLFSKTLRSAMSKNWRRKGSDWP